MALDFPVHTMQRTPWPRLRQRLVATLLGLSALGLVSCGGDADEERFNAALYGPVSSPAFDALSGLLVIEERIETAQVLVVDGDAHAPGTLANDAVVQRHLRDGKWVLWVDLSKDHNDRDLVPLAHSSGGGDSHIAVMRRRSDDHGRPAVDLFDFPRTGAAAPTAPQLDALPRSVGRFLRKPPAQVPTAFNPPPGLIYVSFNFSQPDDTYLFTATKGGSDTSNGTQNTSVERTFVYTLFLDNKNDPTGNFQKLLVHDTVSTSPLNPALGTNKLMITKTGSTFVSRDIGWFQVGVDHGVAAANPANFIFDIDSPQNVNQQETVSTGISFTVGFVNPANNSAASATYSDSVTHDLTQWLVLNNAGGDWSWKNQDPWMDGNTDWGHGFGGGLEFFGQFRVPNSLASGTLYADTKTLYVTPAVVRSIETFQHRSTVTYLNVWAAESGSVQHQYVELPLSSTWQINMAAVIPVPINALTFSPEPVNAFTTSQVTGTVTLAAPAPMDTIVYLQSDSPNATVLSSMTILQGQSSGTFQVLVNTNNLAPGQSTVATILASNAVAYQAPLTVKNGN